MIRQGDHVVVRGEDEERSSLRAPDSQVEVEFLKASEGGPRRRRYAAEALEVIGHGHEKASSLARPSTSS